LRHSVVPVNMDSYRNRNPSVFVVTAALTVSLLAVATSTLEQDRLLDELLRSKYNLHDIPLIDDGKAVNVEIGLVLKKIIQVVRRTIVFVRLLTRVRFDTRVQPRLVKIVTPAVNSLQTCSRGSSFEVLIFCLRIKPRHQKFHRSKIIEPCFLLRTMQTVITSLRGAMALKTVRFSAMVTV